MLGYVFNEFIEMVEHRWGPKVQYDMLKTAMVPQGGAYTAYGWYPHEELSMLIQALGKIIHTSPNDLKRYFGEHVFEKKISQYKEDNTFIPSALAMVEWLDNQLVDDVCRFYPGKKPSRQIKNRINNSTIEVFYESDGQMCHVVDAFITLAAAYFEESFQVDSRGMYFFDHKTIVYSFQKVGDD